MTRPAKWALAVIVVLVVAVLGITLVIVWPLFSPDEPDLNQPGGTKPGSVVAASAYDELPAAMRAIRAQGARLEYMSTDDEGLPTRVSGVGFEPGGDPPAGGWPVIALAHGTTGIDEECGPSRTSNLAGLLSVAQGLTASGYAVVVPDYQGLGSPGVHPYLDSPSAGRNVIDAVRALRIVFGDVSNRWAGYGGSQGGGAVWAANEDSAGYAPELDLLGTFAAVPVTSVVGLVDKAVAGTLTPDQRAAFQAVVESAARSHAEINRDDFRSDVARTRWDSLSACAGPLVGGRDEALGALGPTDLMPRTEQAANALRELLASYALPRKRAGAPMFVVYGDADTFIDVSWTRAAVARACGLSDTISADEQAGKGHGNVDVSLAVNWLKDRFYGKPAPSNC